MSWYSVNKKGNGTIMCCAILYKGIFPPRVSFRTIDTITMLTIVFFLPLKPHMAE